MTHQRKCSVARPGVDSFPYRRSLLRCEVGFKEQNRAYELIGKFVKRSASATLHVVIVLVGVERKLVEFIRSFCGHIAIYYLMTRSLL